MSITLTADLLKKIADSRKRFSDECKNLVSDILNLGRIYNSKIENVD
jgi:hypothetical protein